MTIGEGRKFCLVRIVRRKWHDDATRGGYEGDEVVGVDYLRRIVFE
jgi:hypothetical protein